MFLTKLSIVNFCCYAHHGVDAAEKQLGGRFQVDVDMWYDARKAIKTDSMDNAVDYSAVLDTIADMLRNTELNLIETLAGIFVRELLDRFPLLEEVTVRIRKCNVPIQQVVDYVQAECHKKRARKGTKERKKMINRFKTM